MPETPRLIAGWKPQGWLCRYGTEPVFRGQQWRVMPFPNAVDADAVSTLFDSLAAQAVALTIPTGHLARQASPHSATDWLDELRTRRLYWNVEGAATHEPWESIADVRLASIALARLFLWRVLCDLAEKRDQPRSILFQQAKSRAISYAAFSRILTAIAANNEIEALAKRSGGSVPATLVGEHHVRHFGRVAETIIEEFGALKDQDTALENLHLVGNAFVGALVEAELETKSGIEGSFTEQILWEQQRYEGVLTKKVAELAAQIHAKNSKKKQHDRIVGENIKHYRDLCNWSWQELADAMGMKLQQVKNYGSGDKSASAAMLDRFAIVFSQKLKERKIKVTVADLLSETA
jgi:DNA-binding transcriptional regulator YiaG